MQGCRGPCGAATRRGTPGPSRPSLEQLTLACSTLRGGQSCPPRDGGAALRGGQDCPPREYPLHSTVNCSRVLRRHGLSGDAAFVAGRRDSGPALSPMHTMRRESVVSNGSGTKEVWEGKEAFQVLSCGGLARGWRFSGPGFGVRNRCRARGKTGGKTGRRQISRAGCDVGRHFRRGRSPHRPCQVAPRRGGSVPARRDRCLQRPTARPLDSLRSLGVTCAATCRRVS